MFYGCEITPELLSDIAAAGNPEAAEALAARMGVELPQPLDLDVSADEWRASLLEIERRLA
jgi:hypothetical protein